MQTFLFWINNSLVQSAIISPLIGAILGVFFAGLNGPPLSSGPVTVQQTLIYFNQTIIFNQKGQQTKSTDDVLGYLFGIFILVAGVTWGYSRYAEEILSYWQSGLFSCMAFILSAGLASALRGQYSSYEWGWYIFTPIIAVSFSAYLLNLAQQGIIPGARDAAQSHRFFDFYLNVLQENHRAWLLCQIGGVCLGVAAVLVAAMRSVHYLALMNQRGNSWVSEVMVFSRS